MKHLKKFGKYVKKTSNNLFNMTSSSLLKAFWDHEEQTEIDNIGFIDNKIITSSSKEISVSKYYEEGIPGNVLTYYYVFITNKGDNKQKKKKFDNFKDFIIFVRHNVPNIYLDIKKYNL